MCAFYCYSFHNSYYLNVFAGQYNESATTQVKRIRKTVYCTGPALRTLTRSYLQNMINTVHEVFRDVRASTTVLTTTKVGKQRTYISGKKGHSEDKFIKANPNLAGSHVLWINNSPCPECARKLIEWKDMHINEPSIVIEAAHFYKGDKYPKETVLSCLARMVSKGFTLRAFNWKRYRDLLTNEKCKADINRALRNDKFKEKMKKMEKTIQDVYRYKKKKKIGCKINNNYYYGQSY